MNRTDGYLKFLSFKSVSAEKKHHQDLLDCCHWLKDLLEEIGLETTLWNRSGRPIIFATHLKAGKERPTLLLYTHYDVQPVDPIDLWDSPPFEPKVVDGEVYARGAQDNKGQCWYVIQALKELIEEDGLPVNIKLIIDGEEEIGSFALHELLPKKKEALAADYLAIVDVGIPDIETPAVTLGTRGMAALDLEVACASKDLHSGSHGGLVNNPIQILAEILASSKSQDGTIAIPGFYDNVKVPTDEERKSFNFAFDQKEYEELVGTTATGGETRFAPLERAWLRPTFEINGITGGYSGEGIKTVLPAKASAKISFRLVPGQEPEDILKKACSFFESFACPGVKIEAKPHEGSGAAVRTNPNSKIVQAFASAYTEVFQKPCQFILEGASIPIVPELEKASGSESVLVGLGLMDDQIHSPNEHFGLDRIEKGVKIIKTAINELT